MEKIIPYLLIMRLHKPIGIGLLLWPTLMALWLASAGHPSPHLVAIFTLGVIIMRSAGCVINDWADRKYDGKVERTKTRPLVSGTLEPKQALALFGGLVMIAFLLVLMTDKMTCYLSMGGILLASGYPFMKRYTHFPQVVLGAAFGWAIPMAYSAQLQSLPAQCWILYVATLLWTVAYDTQYAMIDKEDDQKIGIKSTAIAFGKYDKWVIGLLQVSTLLMFLWLGVHLELSKIFYGGLFIALLCMLYQQRLIYHRTQKGCFRAFLNNQWIGLVLFVSIVFSL